MEPTKGKIGESELLLLHSVFNALDPEMVCLYEEVFGVCGSDDSVTPTYGGSVCEGFAVGFLGAHMFTGYRARNGCVTVLHYSYRRYILCRA
jgi:hypothetical protein